MKFSDLKILNVRNHRKTELQLNPGMNIFYGPNGSGKTTVLESLSICGFSKSFVNISDSSLINQNEEFYSVNANLINDLQAPYKINIINEKGKRKKINSNIGDNLLPKDLIGEIPMIILSPDYKNITAGSPEYRRQFIDKILSQSSKAYLELILKYKRVLKQRNSLLNEAKLQGKMDNSQLKSWTETLIKAGSEIIFRRFAFINEFDKLFRETYSHVSGEKEEVFLKYSPNSIESINDDDTIETILEKLSTIFLQKKDEEVRRGVTVFGPQKDDMIIGINNGIAKEIASQGQHKSLLISLKFAEFNYLYEQRKETPVILLDDIFSELDEQRVAKVFELTWSNDAQTFISITEPDNLKNIIAEKSKVDFFKVKGGEITKNGTI